MLTPDKFEPGIRTDLHDARERIAHCATQLVLARMLNATRFPPMPPPHLRAATAQSRWFAQAQDNLQAWIANGGFAQHEDAAPADTDCGALALLK